MTGFSFISLIHSESERVVMKCLWTSVFKFNFESGSFLSLISPLVPVVISKYVIIKLVVIERLLCCSRKQDLRGTNNLELD